MGAFARGGRLAARLLLGALPLVPAAACANLAEIEPSECGNGVVEAGEDCEVHDDDQCIRASEAHGCHWRCASDDDCQNRGRAWRCGREGVCRRPSGTFAEAGLTLPVGEATALQTGDLDGDGRADVVTTNESVLEVHYLRGEADVLQRAAVASVAAPVSPPVVGRFTPHDHDDLAAADDGIVLWRGGEDQRLHPVLAAPFTSSRLPVQSLVVLMMDAMPTVRVPLGDPPIDREQRRGLDPVALLGLPVGGSVYVTAFVSLDTGRYADQTAGVIGYVTGVVPTDIAHLAVGADVVEDEAAPCEELVVAMPTWGDQTKYRLEIHHSCVSTDAGTLAWNGGTIDIVDFDAGTLQEGLPDIEVQAEQLDLSAAGHVERIHLHDFDGDGHLDLLVSSSGGADRQCPNAGRGGHARAWVSYGLGDGRFHSTPPGPAPAEPPDGSLAPVCSLRDTVLAMADLDEDGTVDFVTAGGIYRGSHGQPPQLALQDRRFDVEELDRRWTEAAVGHFNLDEHLDVVATSSMRPGLDYLNGAGPEGYTLAEMPLLDATRAFAVADFDGDRLLDVAIATGKESADASHELLVAFGNPTGPPTTPTSIGTGSFIRSLAAGPLDTQGTLDTAAEIVVVAEDPIRDPDDADAALVQPTISIITGRANRLLVAPHYLMSNGYPGRVDTPVVLSLADLGANGPWWTDVGPDDPSPADHLDLAALAIKVSPTDEKDVTLWPTWCGENGSLWSDSGPSLEISSLEEDPGGELGAVDWPSLVDDWSERPASLPLFASMDLDGDDLRDPIALFSLGDRDAEAAGHDGMIVTGTFGLGTDVQTTAPRGVRAVYPGGLRFEQRFGADVLSPDSVDASISECSGGALWNGASESRLSAGSVRGNVVVEDVDGDGVAELIALGLEPIDEDRTLGQTVLVVLQSDGEGGLRDAADADASYVIRSFSARTSFAADSPSVLVCGITAFALLDADADGDREMVLLTREGAYLADLAPFGPALVGGFRLDGIAGGTAVTAGDFDGDGVDDVAVVDFGGTLRFYRGIAVNPG